jgi:hypothetical protein
VREHLDQLQEDAWVTVSVRTLFIGYAWLYAAFALALTVAMPFDVTHVGDILNVAVALGATLGVYAYLHRKPVLPTSVWRGRTGAKQVGLGPRTLALSYLSGHERADLVVLLTNRACGPDHRAPLTITTTNI